MTGKRHVNRVCQPGEHDYFCSPGALTSPFVSYHNDPRSRLSHTIAENLMALARTHKRFFTTDWLALLALSAVFVGFRLWFAHAGGSYIASPLDSAKQFLDPALLQHDLLSSLWYLHSQPPLFNLFLGLVLKAALRSRLLL